jgi:hypothetical protein
MKTSPLFQFGFMICAILFVATSVGCQGFMPKKDVDIDKAANQEQSLGAIVLEIQPIAGKPKMETIPLQGNMTANDILESKGLTKKYARMELTLIRTIPGTQNRHKMELDYDTRKKRVKIEQDYALYPNDHLVVRQKQFDLIQEAVSSTFGKAGI